MTSTNSIKLSASWENGKFNINTINTNFHNRWRSIKNQTPTPLSLCLPPGPTEKARCPPHSSFLHQFPSSSLIQLRRYNVSESRCCKEGSLCRYGNSPVHLPTSASCSGLVVGGRRYISKTEIIRRIRLWSQKGQEDNKNRAKDLITLFVFLNTNTSFNHLVSCTWCHEQLLSQCSRTGWGYWLADCFTMSLRDDLAQFPQFISTLT